MERLKEITGKVENVLNCTVDYVWYVSRTFWQDYSKSKNDREQSIFYIMDLDCDVTIYWPIVVPQSRLGGSSCCRHLFFVFTKLVLPNTIQVSAKRNAQFEIRSYQ